MKIFITFTLLSICYLSFAQQKEINSKDTSLVPKSLLLQQVLASIEGCNFNNWPNPLKGSTITYPAPLNGNGYSGAASTQWNCITTRENQTWFYVKVLTGGNLKFRFTNSSNVDVDGIIWGPVANDNLSLACSATQSAPLSCDYSVSPIVELPCTTHTDLCGGTSPNGIPAIAGQIYIICILNYANRSTNITLSPPTGGSVYYSQEPPNGLAEHYSNLGPNNGLKLSSFKENGVFKVCADGSEGSFFNITDFPVSTNIKLRIQQDPNALDEKVYGKFTGITPISGGIKVTYRHPSFMSLNYLFRLLNIEVYDQTNNTVLAVYPLRIYRTPLLMIHGLNSEGISFKKMEDEFILSNTHPFDLMLKVDYKPTNTHFFQTNSNVVPRAISEQLLSCLRKGYAVTKVDLVGHSMGGILSRLYLQSIFYLNDINKLITINTPHSGSQMADLLSDPNLRLDVKALACYNIPCNNGAIFDLRVNGLAIDKDLNGSSLNRNTVPSHTIATTSIVSPSGSSILINPIITHYLLELSYDLYSYYDLAYNGNANDLIVQLESQKGGLTGDCTSTYTPQIHVGAQDNSNVINKVKFLLSSDPSTSNFCLGFNPVDLTYTPLAGVTVKNSSLTDTTIKITQPIANYKVNIGNTFTFSATGTGLAKINVLVKASETKMYKYVASGNTILTDITVDNTYNVGDVDILVVGESTTGEKVFTSRKIIVTNCVNSYNLTGTLLQPAYQAINTIETTGVIPPGYKIDFSAGKSILLKPGFETDVYNKVSLSINNCN
ncbi:esterase/lipase family protein [Runella sp.]|uniref:esterase/lipase family protein n=1 Tax=Runella sp. TaxID=1960881 RepID=UPI003D0E2499